MKKSPIPAGKLDVSVVVACRNEAKYIRPFLNSVLAQQTNGLEWEVLVADGMSDDGTRDILLEYSRRDPRVVLLENPGTIVSTGLNLAIHAARGEVIIRMDAHTEYQSDYIRCSVEALRNTDADNVGGPARTKAVGLMAQAIAAAYHSRFSTGGARFHQIAYEGYVDTVPYGCWRKSTLEQLGLFDESLVRNQDDELNLRLIRQGGRIWQSPRIVSWYYLRGSLSGLFRQYFQYGFWKIPVIRKHRIPASWRHLAPGGFVVWNVALILLAAGFWVARRPEYSVILALLAATLLAYSAVCVGVSFLAARGHWATLPLLPVVFSTYHLSYGLGFVCGSVYWSLCRNPPRRMGRLFAGVTR